MKWFAGLCFAGLFGSLLAWVLPNTVKPYHIRHWMDDFNSELITHTSEYGFGPSGLVRVQYVNLYSGGTVAALDKVRQNWIHSQSRSTQRWLTDGSHLQYNDWGPNRYVQGDLVGVTQLGSLYLVPYSFLCLTFAAMLLVAGIIHLRRRRRIGILPLQDAVSFGVATTTPPGGD